MKVLIVCNTASLDSLSGELIALRSEARDLNQLGVKTEIAFVTNEFINIKKYPFKTIWSGLNLFWSVSAFRHMNQLLDQFRPNLVHFHTVHPLLTPSAFYAVKRRSIPVTQTLHNFRWLCVEGGLTRNGSYCQDCIQKRVPLDGIIHRCAKSSLVISSMLTLQNILYLKTGILFSLVDRFIAVSNFVKQKYVAAGFPTEKIIVKYHSIQSEVLNKNPVNISKRLGVTFVGRISIAKGLTVLKKVIHSLDTNPELSYVPFNIVGDGPDLHNLQEFCQTRKVKNVNFWGKVSHQNAISIISKSQCVIIPSLCGETFGLVAAEAMACGVPVVASKVGGLQELLEKSKGGLLVNLHDLDGFVSALIEILRSTVKQAQMAKNGRKFAVENFSYSCTINQLIQIYDSVLTKDDFG